eukprot:126951-Pelagomonas_calceolata.AAC.2
MPYWKSVYVCALIRSGIKWKNAEQHSSKASIGVDGAKAYALPAAKFPQHHSFIYLRPPTKGYSLRKCCAKAIEYSSGVHRSEQRLATTYTWTGGQAGNFALSMELVNSCNMGSGY